MKEPGNFRSAIIAGRIQPTPDALSVGGKILTSESIRYVIADKLLSDSANIVSPNNLTALTIGNARIGIKLTRESMQFTFSQPGKTSVIGADMSDLPMLVTGSPDGNFSLTVTDLRTEDASEAHKAYVLHVPGLSADPVVAMGLYRQTRRPQEPILLVEPLSEVSITAHYRDEANANIPLPSISR